MFNNKKVSIAVLSLALTAVTLSNETIARERRERTETRKERRDKSSSSKSKGNRSRLTAGRKNNRSKLSAGKTKIRGAVVGRGRGKAPSNTTNQTQTADTTTDERNPLRGTQGGLIRPNPNWPGNGSSIGGGNPPIGNGGGTTTPTEPIHLKIQNFYADCNDANGEFTMKTMQSNGALDDTNWATYLAYPQNFHVSSYTCVIDYTFESGQMRPKVVKKEISGTIQTFDQAYAKLKDVVDYKSWLKDYELWCQGRRGGFSITNASEGFENITDEDYRSWCNLKVKYFCPKGFNSLTTAGTVVAGVGVVGATAGIWASQAAKFDAKDKRELNALFNSESACMDSDPTDISCKVSDGKYFDLDIDNECRSKLESLYPNLKDVGSSSFETSESEQREELKDKINDFVKKIDNKHITKVALDDFELTVKYKDGDDDKTATLDLDKLDLDEDDKGYDKDWGKDFEDALDELKDAIKKDKEFDKDDVDNETDDLKDLIDKFNVSEIKNQAYCSAVKDIYDVYSTMADDDKVTAADYEKKKKNMDTISWISVITGPLAAGVGAGLIVYGQTSATAEEELLTRWNEDSKKWKTKDFTTGQKEVGGSSITCSNNMMGGDPVGGCKKKCLYFYEEGVTKVVNEGDNIELPDFDPWKDPFEDL